MRQHSVSARASSTPPTRALSAAAKIPANRTKFPPMRQTAHTYLTAAEVAALTVACGLQGDVVSVLAYTGLRFGELVGLNVEDVDLDVRRIRV